MSMIGITKPHNKITLDESEIIKLVGYDLLLSLNNNKPLINPFPPFKKPYFPSNFDATPEKPKEVEIPVREITEDDFVDTENAQASSFKTNNFSSPFINFNETFQIQLKNNKNKKPSIPEKEILRNNNEDNEIFRTNKMANGKENINSFQNLKNPLSLNQEMGGDIQKQNNKIPRSKKKNRSSEKFIKPEYSLSVIGKGKVDKDKLIKKKENKSVLGINEGITRKKLQKNQKIQKLNNTQNLKKVQKENKPVKLKAPMQLNKIKPKENCKEKVNKQKLPKKQLKTPEQNAVKKHQKFLKQKNGLIKEAKIKKDGSNNFIEEGYTNGYKEESALGRKNIIGRKKVKENLEKEKTNVKVSDTKNLFSSLNTKLSDSTSGLSDEDETKGKRKSSPGQNERLDLDKFPIEFFDEKNREREDLWRFNEKSEKENIRNFWKGVPKKVKISLATVNREVIIPRLSRHLRASCRCGHCPNNENRLIKELSDIYDRFYEELNEEEKKKFNKNQQGSCYVVKLGDNESSLRVESGGLKIDEQFNTHSSTADYIDKLTYYLCTKTKFLRNINSELAQDSDYREIEETLESDAIEAEALASPPPNETPLPFTSNDEKSEHLICKEELDELSSDAMKIANMASPTSVEFELIIKEKMRELCEEVAKEINGSFAVKESEEPSDLGDKFEPEVKKNLTHVLQLIMEYAHPKTLRESLGPRVRMLIRFLFEFRELNNSIRKRHLQGHKSLETIQIKRLKKIEFLPLENNPVLGNDYTQIELRETMVRDQRTLCNRQLQEKTIVQQEVFKHLLYILRELVFCDPLRKLDHRQEAELMTHFKSYASVEGNLYDELLAKEYFEFVCDSCPVDSAISANRIGEEGKRIDAIEEQKRFSGEEMEEEDLGLEEKYEDCCEVFKYYTVKLFHQRVIQAYMEKVSVKKQEALIEEENEEQRLRNWRRLQRQKKRKRYRKKARERGGNEKDSA